jgi:hypothetical protein
MQRISQGSVDEVDYAILNEDWNVDERFENKNRYRESHFMTV